MPATATTPRSSTRVGRAAVVVATVAGLFALAGCSSPAPSKSALSDALVDSGLSVKVADCTAAALTKSLTSAELAEITERGSGGAPVDDPKDPSDSADKLAKAMAVCRDLQLEEQPTTTTTAAAGGSTTTAAVTPQTDGAEFNTTSTTAAP